MKTLKRTLFLTLALALNLSAHADQPQLFGTWELKEFVIIDKSGHEADFCSRMTGKIIYEASGGMSASINCFGEELGPVPADQYGGKLFYAANFSVEGDIAIHQVTNASDSSLIGKSLKRKLASLTSSELVLTGPLGEGALRIVWTR